MQDNYNKILVTICQTAKYQFDAVKLCGWMWLCRCCSDVLKMQQSHTNFVSPPSFCSFICHGRIKENKYVLRLFQKLYLRNIMLASVHCVISYSAWCICRWGPWQQSHCVNLVLNFWHCQYFASGWLWSPKSIVNFRLRHHKITQCKGAFNHWDVNKQSTKPRMLRQKGVNTSAVSHIIQVSYTYCRKAKALGIAE